MRLEDMGWAPLSRPMKFKMTLNAVLDNVLSILSTLKSSPPTPSTTWTVRLGILFLWSTASYFHQQRRYERSRIATFRKEFNGIIHLRLFFSTLLCLRGICKSCQDLLLTAFRVWTRAQPTRSSHLRALFNYFYVFIFYILVLWALSNTGARGTSGPTERVTTR